GCSRSNADEQTAGPGLATVERRDLSVSAEAAGLVEPIQMVEIKSKASGEVLSVLVETGQEVTRGATLVQVDPRDVRNALAQAEADLEVAEARLETSSANRRRVEELSKSNVATAQELESAVLEAANARAQLIKARTNLELARERMNDVTIRAPIGGTIIEKAIEPGSIIASASGTFGGGTTLLKMADLAIVRVRALVDQTDIGKVQPGQRALVTVEAYPGRPFTGEVVKVEPSAVVDQNVTMFPVLIHLRNNERLLKPGMNTEVEIQIAERSEVAVIPNDAVVALRDASTAGAALGLSEDDMRAKLEARRTGMRTRPGMGGGARRNPNARPGIVFTPGASGPVPKLVMLGVNDWEFTEVISGLEAGEKVFLMTAARLQQQQQDMQDRVRQRSNQMQGMRQSTTQPGSQPAQGGR
ncbi:MAG: efflux RND transporter periplasmic adaptor subunit, partial [Gemmatimonadota bacterium]